MDLVGTSAPYAAQSGVGCTHYEEGDEVVAVDMQLSIQSLSTKATVAITDEITADETSTFVFSSSQKYRLVLDIDLSEVLTDQQRAAGQFEGELSMQLHFTHPNKRLVESEEDLQYFLSRVETLIEQDTKDPELPNLRQFLHINEFSNVPVTVIDGRLTVITRIWPCIFSGTKRRTKTEDHENIEFQLIFTSAEGRLPVVARTSANVRVVPKSSYYKQKQRKMPAKNKRAGGKGTSGQGREQGAAAQTPRSGTRPINSKNHFTPVSRRSQMTSSVPPLPPGLPQAAPVRQRPRPPAEDEYGEADMPPPEGSALDIVAQRQLEQLQLQHLQQLQLQELHQKQEQQKAALLISQQLQLRQSIEAAGDPGTLSSAGSSPAGPSPAPAAGTRPAEGSSEASARDLLGLGLFARPAPKLGRPASTGSRAATPESPGQELTLPSGLSTSPLTLGGRSMPSLTSFSRSLTSAPRAGSLLSSSSSSAGASLTLGLPPRRPLLSTGTAPLSFTAPRSPSGLSLGSPPSRLARPPPVPVLSQSLPNRPSSPSQAEALSRNKRPRLSI